MTDNEQNSAEEESKSKPGKKASGGVEVPIKGKELAEIISDAVERVSDSLLALQVKPTMAEYLRLLDHAKELKINARGKEVVIKWIEPDETWSDEA